MLHRQTALKLEQRKIRIISLFCCGDCASWTVRQLRPDSGPQLLWQNLTDWGKEVASELNGSCVCGHRHNASVIHTSSICTYTHRACKAQASSNCSSHVHAISRRSILFPRHFTNCAHQICVGSTCGGGSFSS